MNKINKKIIYSVLYLLLVNIVLFSVKSQTYLLESHNRTDWANDAQTTLKLGMIVEMKETAYINNITLAASDTASYCWIYDGTGTTALTSAISVVSGVCDLGSTFLANISEKYRIVVGSGGSSFMARTTGTPPPYPIEGTRITWIRATYGTTSITNNDSVAVRDIWKLGTTNYVLFDSTPPSFTVNRVPNNFTLETILTQNNYINSSITDSTGVLNSSIYMEFLKNNTYTYLNGSLINPSRNFTYTNASGSLYFFYIDEQDTLGGTFNYDSEYMESVQHTNFSFSGVNNWLKIQFLNVSNNANYNFEEIMADNATISSDVTTYYYCNSSYTTGNPVSNNNCVIIYSAPINRVYNHSHSPNGFSKHKIIPFNLNISTGKIGNVYVTPISYFLKQASTSTELVYYISNISRINAIQTSNNNGNTWSNFAGTIDAHLHQIYNNASINYKICANDSYIPNNYGCSSWYYDIIDLPNLNPSSVAIFNPINSSYNTSILINHSSSSVSSGYIVSYLYYYRVENSSTWNFIYNNSDLSLTYQWDISGLTEQNYQLRVRVFDNLGQYTDSYSMVFLVDNPLSEEGKLLTEINLNLIESNKKQIILSEAITMIGWIILFSLFIFLGIYVSGIFWGIDFLLSLYFGIMTFANQSNYANFSYFLATIFFWFTMTIFFFMGTIVLLVSQDAKKKKKKNMYDDFY